MINRNLHFNPLIIQAESQCILCGNVIKDSYYSKCKHSFCKTCINNHLSRNNRCPVCSAILKIDEVYPNILAKHVKNMYFIDTFNGKLIDEDMHTKFKRKFEYADFLIELTIIKNFLWKIYDQKLKELEEFRKKLIYLKKDIIFLESILNNSEDDIFCFLDKLMKNTNFTINEKPTNSDKIREEESNSNKKTEQGTQSQKRTNNSNLENDDNEEQQDNSKNKRIKLDHSEVDINMNNSNVALEDLNDNKYINYNSVRNIITKVLNENVKGESLLKSLIINSYKENILNSTNNDAVNTSKNHHQNNSVYNSQINPLINPVLSTTTSFALDTCNCVQGEFGAPAYLDVNFCYVDPADDKNGSSTSNGNVMQENNNMIIDKVDMTNSNQNNPNSDNKSSINTNNQKLKDPEIKNETDNRSSTTTYTKNTNNSGQKDTNSKQKMKNVDYGSDEDESISVADEDFNSNINNTNGNNYSYNTHKPNRKDNCSSENEINNNNNNSNNKDTKVDNLTFTEKEKQLLEEESKITKKILKDINKEQKQLKSSLSKKMKNLMNRERQIEKNKKEIEKCYFTNQKGFCPEYCLKDQCLNLSRFTNYFKKFSQYTQLRTVASINYADNFLNNSSCIVSAVEFDKNDDFFASAGVLKKIRIYDFNNVIYNYRELYKNEKNEFESIIYQQDEHRQREGKSRIELDASNSFYFPSSSSPSNNNKNNQDINKQNNDVSSSSLLPYMSSLPNKIPLTSILLNPEIELVTDDSSYNSNHSYSSHDTSSESADNSYMSSSNLDYITRYPIQEMACNSKISCLSYSYEKQRNLLSSDYEGIITLWDAETGTAVSNFNEHEKRAWCVDYNSINPTLFASGSDDATVKIWDENVPYSTLTIDSRANICSVAFNPYNEYEIAFGSADHNIYYYDLRNAKRAWECIRGHKKAISYVKFRNRYEFVSASTDNTLKLWSINPYVLDMNNNENIKHKVQLIRTYSGHANERNFAGLSINKDGDFILCGSETNEIYIYYSEFEKPIIVQNFGNIEDNVTGSERDYFDTNQFISSLSWKKTSENILVAANSEGRVKVFELV